MADGSTEPIALIELIGDAAGEVDAELARSAYACSRMGLIGLVLTGASRATVDRALGPAVASEPGVAGVLYLDPDDENGLTRAVRSARIALAQSDAFRRFAERHAVAVAPVTEMTALARLGAIRRPAA